MSFLPPKQGRLCFASGMFTHPVSPLAEKGEKQFSPPPLSPAMYTWESRNTIYTQLALLRLPEADDLPIFPRQGSPPFILIDLRNLGLTAHV